MKPGVHLFLFAVLLNTKLLFAADNEPNNELSAVQNKIKQVSADLKKLTSQRNVQIEDLRTLEKQYGELSNTVLKLKVDIKQKEENLKTVRSKVSVMEKNIQFQQRALAGLIKSAYVIGNQEGLKVILSQHDPSISGRMLIYYDYIGKARLQRLNTIQEDAKSLRILEAQKDTENQILQIALDKKQQETDDMQALKNQRENLLSQMNKDFLSKSEQMERLIHDEKKLEVLLASLEKTGENIQADSDSSSISEVPNTEQQQPLSEQVEQDSAQKKLKIDKDNFSNNHFADLQGQLPWPVKGQINERFGHPRFETIWDGTVINAREGADIRAVAPGRVVFADWLRGYGLMVIVDHGKGYMSLYGFNQSLHKEIGQQVMAGETLASVGRSGGRTQAALYFGIRVNGKPVDPERWCRKPAKED